MNAGIINASNLALQVDINTHFVYHPWVCFTSCRGKCRSKQQPSIKTLNDQQLSRKEMASQEYLVYKEINIYFKLISEKYKH